MLTDICGKSFPRNSVFCFFRAGAGIRAATGTGVQTCALPILREGAVGGQVVDGDDLDVPLAAAGAVAGGAEEVAAYAAEAVDPYTDGHASSRWLPIFGLAEFGTRAGTGEGQGHCSPGCRGSSRGRPHPRPGFRSYPLSSAPSRSSSSRRRRARTAPLERGGSSSAPSSARVASG